MLLDVWNAKSFDDEIKAVLNASSDIVRSYLVAQKEIFQEHDNNSDVDRPLLRPSNPYCDQFTSLIELLSKCLEKHEIRAWHYTRMIDEEVEALVGIGIHMSTPDTLQKRLRSLVSAGLLGEGVAEKLFAASPFQSDQREAREGKFYLVSHPQNVDDSGVNRLLRYWGGEVASFHTDDPSLLIPLNQIGRGRVVEVAVPLAATEHSVSAARAIVATFAHCLGCKDNSHAFDVCVREELKSLTVLRVHSEGEDGYREIGKTYPNEFLDMDAPHWEWLNDLQE